MGSESNGEEGDRFFLVNMIKKILKVLTHLVKLEFKLNSVPEA
jgi:hypothetical protein